MKKLLSIASDGKGKGLRIAFPPRVVSTNVDELRAELSHYHESAEGRIQKNWTSLLLDFTRTDFVDSMGLNLVFDLVKLAENRKAPISALLKSRAVRLTFYTVRLDKKMEILLVETQA